MKQASFFGHCLPSLLLLAGLSVALSGCTEPSHSSNIDSAFLNAPLNSITSQDPQSNLLPLTPGNTWQMRTVARGQRFYDVIQVSKSSPATGKAPAGVELQITRDGKPWRREFYLPQSNEVVLSAMQDETSPLMVLNPPLTLVKTPLEEGQMQKWRGTLTLKGVDYPATAFSRLSSYEPVTASAGLFKAYRIDTVVTITGDGRELRFPSVRWLAPGVGFVRRGFADQGQPAFSELLQFNVH